MNQLSRRCATGIFYTKSIDEILRDKPFNPPLKTYRYEDYPPDPSDPDLQVKTGDTWVYNFTKSGPIKAARRESLRTWWLEKMLTGDMHDVMTFFWHNHFGVSIERSGYEAHFCWNYYMVLRNNAMGDFKKMILDVSLSAAMMEFLNGNTNTGKNPNKNFARELLELFTVSRGNYTEQDVVEAAKCLSGYWLDYNTGKAEIDRPSHDNSDKQFSVFFGNRIIKGDYENEVPALIDMIFETQPMNVATFICTKLYRFFINATVDMTFVGMMAEEFMKHNFNIRPVLKFMMSSAHFYDLQFTGSIVKSPIDLLASVIRDFAIPMPKDPVQRYWTLNKLRLRLEPMMTLGDPPGVDGWKAYYQSPEFDGLWYNSSTAQYRQQLLMDLFSPWLFSVDGEGFWIDVIRTAKTFSNPSNPDLLVSESLSRMLPFPISTEEQQRIKKETLLTGLENRHWTKAWKNYIADPSPANESVVKERLTALYQYIILSESYQQK